MDYYESDSPPRYNSIISGNGVSSQSTSGAVVASVYNPAPQSYFSMKGSGGAGDTGGYTPQTLTVCLNGVPSTITVLGTTPVAI